jgi:hypothetical protein
MLKLVVGPVLDRPGGTTEGAHLVGVRSVAFEPERDLVQRVEWFHRFTAV